MARPIEPTPPLEGQDAEELFSELQRGASPQEMARRADAARARLAELTNGKPVAVVSPENKGTR